jgi:hypothetical protein
MLFSPCGFYSTDKGPAGHTETVHFITHNSEARPLSYIRFEHRICICFFCENCICFQFGRMLHPSLAASSSASPLQVSASPARRRSVAIPCAPNSGGAPAGDTKPTLKVGSPIVILEAPTMLKTAASVPSLRHNAGQVKPGDVGRLGAL